MNKFEKLIEYIINDEDQKARELFRNIVVEKSRDIYENIMTQEEVHGNPVTDMVDEIDHEESMGEDEEFSLDADSDHDGEPEGELDGEPEGQFGEPEGEEAEHQEIEHQVMSIDTKLDELLAKFDEIMGHDTDDHEMEEPMGEPASEPQEYAMDQENDIENESMNMMEGEMCEECDCSPCECDKDEDHDHKVEEAKKIDKKDVMKNDMKKDDKKKTEESRAPRIRSTAELMREYTEKIADINLEPSTFPEGEAVGTGNKTGKVAVNKKPGSVGPGNNFGGDANMAHGGEQNNDGKNPQTANNEYNKGQTEQPLAKKDGGYKNKIGGNKQWNQGGDGGHGAEKNGDSETGKKVGDAKDGNVSINKKPVQVQNTGKK